MQTIFDEELIPFNKAIRSLPGRPHISTGYRFISRGCRGVVLESIMIGGRQFTSRQALRRFAAAVTAASSHPHHSDQSSTEPARAPFRENLEPALDEAGL